MITIKLLADANIPQKAVDILRRKGIDIVSIHEINPRLKNREVAIIASSQNRIIITADKTFLGLSLRRVLESPESCSWSI